MQEPKTSYRSRGLEAEGAGAEGEEGNDYAADTAGALTRKNALLLVVQEGKPLYFPLGQDW